LEHPNRLKLWVGRGWLSVSENFELRSGLRTGFGATDYGESLQRGSFRCSRTRVPYSGKVTVAVDEGN
ncbi:hypothetical protein HAX54_001578, partial [Datura stramonium]|nr:hypothetical protein [Datura stramonium]